MKDGESKREKKELTTFCKLLIMVKKHTHIQMAQEIVVNYDEAQRDKSTPDYIVHGA